MIPISESSKFLSQWNYVEFARFIPQSEKVARIKNPSGTELYPYSDIEGFREQFNNTGLYTSVWFYNELDLNSSVRFGPLYFDLDSDNLEISFSHVKKLADYLYQYMDDSAVSIFFTGKKGFHIECNPIALGINPSNNLKNIYRHIASSLKEKLDIDSLDLQVYDNRRMWRLEGSIHQDTGLYKTRIPFDMLGASMDDVKQYSSIPQLIAGETPVFNSVSNQWFREYSYNLEIEKERSKDFIGYFNKHGSKAFKKVESYDKEFTPKNLLENCPSIKRLWEEAIEKKHLDHEARLFLCSILTYSEESIKFLHGILSNCDDYNFEKTDSHIQDWVRRRELGIGGRPFTCARANASGVGCMECHLESKPRWIQVGDRYVQTEEKMDPSPVRFAYRSRLKGGVDNVGDQKSR